MRLFWFALLDEEHFCVGKYRPGFTAVSAYVMNIFCAYGNANHLKIYFTFIRKVIVLPKEDMPMVPQISNNLFLMIIVSMKHMHKTAFKKTMQIFSWSSMSYISSISILFRVFWYIYTIHILYKLGCIYIYDPYTHMFWSRRDSISNQRNIDISLWCCARVAIPFFADQNASSLNILKFATYSMLQM